MHAHRPFVLVLGTCLLQACIAPQTKPAKAMELTFTPILRMQHSANQSAATYYQLGKYHLERGNLELARAAYDTSIAMDGRQLEARNAIAALDAQEGRLDEAKDRLLQIVADHPQIAHPHNNLGYVYYLQNNYDPAIAHLQKALALDPDNAWARNNLTTVMAAQASHAEHAAVAGHVTPRAIPGIPSQNTSVVSEPVQTDPHSQGLMIKHPAPEPLTRMEVVQIVPNVYELRLKSAIDAVLTELKPATVTARPSQSMGPPVEINPRVEVANGNGVPGMAYKVKDILNQQGITVSRLTNAKPYKQQATKIQYREGYQQAAEALKTALNGRAAITRSDHLSAKSDVRLVLGKDVVSHTALLEKPAIPPLLALNDTSSR